MKKLLATIALVVLYFTLPVLVFAQDVAPTTSPTPEDITIKAYPATPPEILLSGKDKGSQLSGEIIVDLTEIPTSAVVLDIELSFTQTGTSEGLLKILNKRSLSIIDSIALGKEGQKTTSRVDTTVEDWITKPDNNFGLILQSSELGASSEVTLSEISFSIEYYVPDKTNPVIIKSEVTRVNEFTVNLKWETDEPVIVYANYGKTSNYDKQTETTIEYTKMGNMTLTDLSENITYHYKLTATDPSGNKTETANTVFTTNSGQSNSQTPSGTGVLAPRLLNHEITTEGNQYEVQLAWSKSETENITGYIIFKNVGDAEYSELSRLDQSVTRFGDNRVEHGKTYNYYVVAYSGSSQSGRSPVSSVSIPQNSGVLGLGSILDKGNSNVAIFLILSGMSIVLSVAYFISKKVKLNMAYNEKMTRHARLHNVLHDPNYYINGYEDAVIEKVNE